MFPSMLERFPICALVSPLVNYFDVIVRIEMTAKTKSGTSVTVNTFDVIIEDGKPVIMFFVKDENGQYGIFNQNELHEFKE
jgi:hypothetical protein